MCGIVAVLDIVNNVNKLLYNSLLNIQHRGQECSGFIIFSSNTKKTYKSKKFGLIDSHLDEISSFEGNIGLGHNRYPTGGQITRKEIQPFSILKPYGISLVHNGNLTNKEYLEDFLYQHNIFLNSTSDSEIILNLFYYFIDKEFNKLNNENIVKCIKNIYNLCTGSFSVIIMIRDYGLISFRDKHGIRPLVYNIDTNNLIISSETCSFINNTKYENISNGEIMIVDLKLNITKYKIFNEDLKPCIFEYIYFASPESYINDILVYRFREEVGFKMAEIISENIKTKNIQDIDLVIPIPLTSIVSANVISNKLNKPLKYAVMKNRYTYRTFINKGNDIINSVKKIKIINEIVKDKNILLVDDSIVRGNTSKHIISELIKAGVKKIYFASCSPPVRFPNVYGIYIPSHQELIAHKRSNNDIKKKLNLDNLFYLPLDDLLGVLKKLNPKIQNFEDSTFSGNYIDFN